MNIDPIVVISIRVSPEYMRNQKWCKFIHMICQNL